MTDEDFLQAAIHIARDGMLAGKGGPFGAVVVKDGRIVGQGCNAVTSTNDPTAHAEVVAIRDACQNLDTFQLTDCTVYASCEPCPMCLGAIYWARPDRLVFAATRTDAAEAGFDDAFIYQQLNQSLSERTIPTIRIETQEAKAVLEAWKTLTQKTAY